MFLGEGIQDLSILAVFETFGLKAAEILSLPPSLLPAKP